MDTPPPLPFETAAARRPVPRSRLYGPGYDPVFRGVRVRAGTVLDYDQRLFAARLVLGESAVFVGTSAAHALGVRTAWPDDPVHANVQGEHPRRHREGLRVHRDALAEADVVSSAFGRTTCAARTAVDLACEGSRGLALSRLDALARAVPLDVPDLLTRAWAARGRRGIRQARELIPLLDPRSESPRESVLRLAMLDFGLPVPTPQLEVLDPRGRFVARLDFGWEEERVGIEYDGAVHRESDVHSRDLRRHNELRSEGWLVFQLDSRGLRSCDRVFAAVNAAILSRREGRRSAWNWDMG